MNTFRIVSHLSALAAATMMCLASCSKIDADRIRIQADENDFREKIINTKSSCSPCSEVLLKFKETPSLALLDSLATEGIVLRPAVTSVPGKEKMEKEFGLDLWYVCPVDDSEAESIAEGLARSASVSTVEYGVQYVKASDCVIYPLEKSQPVQVRTDTKADVVFESVFNDPYLVKQWHYMNIGDRAVATDCYAGADINVKDVWKSLTAGDNTIIVAVVDEGVKYNHPDLAANMWTGPDGEHGRNFCSPSGEITWTNNGDTGHATHCAGTISAVNNNRTGVCGIAGGSGNGDGVKIMSCQIFDGKTGGSSTIIANAVKYAADNGASIISCSFGYKGGTYKSDSEYLNGNSGANSLEMSAIRYFEAAKNNDVLDGGIAIFSSGNDGDPYATYPGAYNDIISVSAFGPDYLPAYYTNYGPGCNIVAPGGEAYHSNSGGSLSSSEAMVLSTIPSELKDSDYGYMQGTSMACPHVSGIVALALSYARKLGRHYSLSEFKNMIVTSANDLDSRITGTKTLNGKSFSLAPYYHKMGTGSIDAWTLMMKIEGVPSIGIRSGERQWVDISPYFGTSSKVLTYMDIEVLDNGSESLGLVEEPYIKYGKLFIYPTRLGSARVRITAVGGGDAIGGDDAIGGMKVTQDVSVVSRNVKSSNGGWL